MQFAVVPFMAVALFLHFALGWGFFESLLWAIPVAVGAILVLSVVVLPFALQSTKQADRAEREFRIRSKPTVEGLIQKHMPALMRRRRLLVHTDDYGVVDNSKWEKELENFLKNVLSKVIVTEEADEFLQEERLLWVANDLLSPALRKAVDEADGRFPLSYDADMSPVEYEQFCADRLQSAGWTTTLTKASGDQGADIIASKGKDILIVQCKRYAKPAGNKCVQEASAAQRHYSATGAVVVATNGFTKAARALAATNGVHLISHDDLHDDAHFGASTQ